MPDKPSQFNKAAGERLRRCREFLGLTQVDFAAALGISRTVLENAESGDNCPRPLAVERARVRFGVTHDWVYGGNAYLLPDDMKADVVARIEAPKERKRAKG